MKKENTLILVVDDEPDILNLLDYNLKKAGFKVLQAKDGPEAIELAVKKKPSLVLLDIMLPDMDGTEVLKRLKSDPLAKHIPVIMLTAKGEEVDRVVGFELGAEDYITKPFSPRELVLRVKAMLKRSNERPSAPTDGVLGFGEITLDVQRHKITAAGKEVRLSATEFGLLAELLGSKGRAFSRDMLLDRVWGIDCYVTPRTVDTHIRRLRAKLKAAGRYIETVRGLGYRFKDE
ncbi:MAG: response regulator [Deltaproteobacteria bacterium]|nr:response regulator [Deltaproteobacteria bacterium]